MSVFPSNSNASAHEEGQGQGWVAAGAAARGQGEWLSIPCFYLQWLNSLGTAASSYPFPPTPPLPPSFSLYPHSFHLSSTQTVFRHHGSMTPFLFPFLSPSLPLELDRKPTQKVTSRKGQYGR